MNGVRAAFGAVLWAVLTLASHASQEEHTRDSPRWHALFVACSEYEELERARPDTYEDEIRLHGPVHDAALLRDRLERTIVDEWASVTTLAGWPEAEEEQPTLRNIESALRDLASQDLDGARVLLYFAGHGARQLDRNGDEADGLDEVFLAADAKPARNGRIPGALSDDMLARHVAALRRAGASVWVVMDCCHAATGMRGDDHRHRGLSDEQLDIPPTEPPEGRRDRPDPLGTDLEGVVAFYASESTARTPELDLKVEGTEQRHGLFTWALALELERMQPGETFHQLFARVEERYRTHPAAGGTIPLAEGDVLLTLDGRGHGAARLGWLQSERLTSDPALARASQLRVNVIGESTAVDAILKNAEERAVRWSAEGADATVDVTGERVLLQSPQGSVLIHDIESLGRRLGALRLLNVARALERRKNAAGALALTIAARPRRSGQYAPISDSSCLRPETDLRAQLSRDDVTTVDLYVISIDGSMTPAWLFPRGNASQRLSSDARRDLDLFRRGEKVLHEGLGNEWLVVLAFPRAMGDPQVHLGSIDVTATDRSGEVEGPLPWVITRELRTGWNGLRIPWPKAADSDALVAGLSERARNSIVVVRAAPDSAPHEARIDLDGDGVRGDVTGWSDGPRFDLVLRDEGQNVVALYDTDGDGTLDLELTDGTRDGLADSFREHGERGWTRPRIVQLPLIDLCHFGSRAAAFDPRRVLDILTALFP